MRCTKCGKKMVEKKERMFGELVSMAVCPACGKKLVDVEDAIRLQQKVMPRIHEVRRVVAVGSSCAVTIPAGLAKVFPKGEDVILDFDPVEMKLEIRKK